ncbi:hypothetical protein EYF80_041558 [Liparis tanakae]|uniref:Uncharacterized protein n=1 Tax=Liparis tanakae TaxID=230148 RepID=A0A4Z2G644_9TELE|nr:hypothetical protein EYF80_041558 [Liparis tanakae]
MTTQEEEDEEEEEGGGRGGPADGARLWARGGTHLRDSLEITLTDHLGGQIKVLERVSVRGHVRALTPKGEEPSAVSMSSLVECGTHAAPRGWTGAKRWLNQAPDCAMKLMLGAGDSNHPG